MEKKEEKEKRSRTAGASGRVHFENPDPSLWTERSITSGQFSKSKQEDGPYKGSKPVR